MGQISDFIRDLNGIKCFNRLGVKSSTGFNSFVEVALIEDIVRFDGFLVCLSLIPGHKNAVRDSHTNVKAVDFVQSLNFNWSCRCLLVLSQCLEKKKGSEIRSLYFIPALTFKNNCNG